MMNRTAKLVLTTSALFLALFVGRPEPVSAATTATVHVTANVVASCSISNSPLDFGTYDPFGANVTAPKDANAPLSYACTSGTSAWIGLDHVGARAMVNGSSNLAYELYTADPTGTTSIWGDSQATGVAITGAGAAATVQMYGRIPGGQTGLVAGAYAQDIQATINF
jgi:spore coat protein U-like protein